VTTTVHLLTAGYAAEHVASSVTLVRDGDALIVADPGMVSSRARILGPLADLGVAPEDVTHVFLSHHHPDHTINVALFPSASPAMVRRSGCGRRRPGPSHPPTSPIGRACATPVRGRPSFLLRAVSGGASPGSVAWRAPPRAVRRRGRARSRKDCVVRDLPIAASRTPDPDASLEHAARATLPAGPPAPNGPPGRATRPFPGA